MQFQKLFLNSIIAIIIDDSCLIITSTSATVLYILFEEVLEAETEFISVADILGLVFWAVF